VNLALFRNCLMAALRNLAGNPVQSAIAIGSLAIGLWAAILAGIIADNQAGYDRFIPGSRQIYTATFQGLATGDVMRGGFRGGASSSTPHDLAGYLRGFPEVREVTRLNNNRGTFSRDDLNNREEFSWADPNFFRLMRVPALYGDPATALERPDGLVISRSMARKYFGRDDARGEILTLNHQTAFVVRAVIVDVPPHASNLVKEIYLSALAPISPLALNAGQPGMGPQVFMMSVTTFARLADGSVGGLGGKTTTLVRRLLSSMPISRTLFVRFLRLDEIQLSPDLHPANRDRLETLITISALVLLLACINFVSLSLARSMRRAVEVGIRKAAGAGRGLLVAQFLGETVLQALMALCAAMALVEWSLPLANSYMQSGAVFSWWRDPLLLAGLLGGTVLVGVVAGIYPALVLSAFRPAAVLKGLMLRGSALGTRLRQGLVALQFAIPLALVIAATVVFQQDRFTATEALRLDTDQMLMINLPICGSAIEAEVSALPGVTDAACSGPSLLPSVMLLGETKSRNNQPFDIVTGEVGFGFFRVYHLPALAGRLPNPAHPGDAVPVRQPQPAPGSGLRAAPPANRPPPPPAHYIINEAAVKALGYASAADAIGKPLHLRNGPKPTNDEIIGVVRDFSLYPPLEKTRPTAYKTATDTGGGMRGPGFDAAALHVRLKGPEIAETLAAIDAVWKRHSQDPVNRIFLNDFVQQQQIDVLRQGQAFAAFAGVAALLACLGLFGLSLAAAGQRIKEIGVRKAMGAENRQIIVLLLWQFSRPVLWANVIAWPVAWWLMRRWLAGFPYHIALQWWVFALGSATMLLIALLTVAGHALDTARRKPVLALRYE
jgi:putative ABC transport system permease protein